MRLSPSHSSFNLLLQCPPFPFLVIFLLSVCDCYPLPHSSFGLLLQCPLCSFLIIFLFPFLLHRAARLPDLPRRTLRFFWTSPARNSQRQHHSIRSSEESIRKSPWRGCSESLNFFRSPCRYCFSAPFTLLSGPLPLFVPPAPCIFLLMWPAA
jgi:hypothetical protein